MNEEQEVMLTAIVAAMISAGTVIANPNAPVYPDAKFAADHAHSLVRQVLNNVRRARKDGQ